METKDHEYFMKKAIQMAEQAEEQGEVPVGAVLVCEGRIITKTHNQTELLHDATGHAEMLAIGSCLLLSCIVLELKVGATLRLALLSACPAGRPLRVVRASILL
jgi:pyrimidine deaminase RibD-like protein